MDLAWLGSVAGGIGLFLLGVRLMTEGLRVAAGRALEGLLERATKSRLRALATGFGLTALVQSSSAVTVAAIGFVNAGLLGLGEALWVVFGSNVGTTVTGWLVSVSGVDVDLAAYALPMVGVGALARVLDRRRRLGALGQALAGLGLFFLGIGILGDAFRELAASIELGGFGSGPLGQLALFGVGMLLTVTMQSSSAAIAVTLSAAAGGLIDLHGAGAMVIGANLGTTSTALLSVIGATPAARRTAAGHVVFNLLAAVVALLLLPWLLGLIQLGLSFGRGGDVAIAPTLALFHTVFNVLGVVLVWPFAGRLERALARRWVTEEEERSRPRHLDHTVLAVPEVALEAIHREMVRLASHACDVVSGALAPRRPDAERLARQIAAFESLGVAISRFGAQVAQPQLSEDASAALTRLLRARRHYDTAVEDAKVVLGLRESLAARAPRLAALEGPLPDALREAAEVADPRAEGFALADTQEAIGRVTERWERARAALLEDTAKGTIGVDEAVASQHLWTECRRAVKQLARGAADLAPDATDR